jgi:hypothetical protein
LKNLLKRARTDDRFDDLNASFVAGLSALLGGKISADRYKERLTFLLYAEECEQEIEGRNLTNLFTLIF